MLRVTAAWTNWAGTAKANPAALARPESTDDVSRAVLWAADRGMRVKAVGSGHSFTPIAVTDGLLLGLDRLAGIVAIDTATGQVTVRAGTRLHDLNRELADHGLAMENLGDIDRQSISGAIATGTHGTGARFRGLAASVRGMRIVLADGSVVDCDADRDEALFEAARVGLGALGVVTELILQCVPAFLLHAREEPGSLTETLARLDELVAGTDHVEFYWFPHTDRVLLKRNSRLPVDAGADPLPRWRAWLDDDVLANSVFELVNRVSAARPAWVPSINAMSSRVLSAREFTMPSFEVFASERRVRFREMEYAIPREAVVEVLLSLRDFVDSSGVLIPFPVEVRFAAADDVWLSTATGRDTAYIAVHQYHRMDHQPYFAGFEALARSVDGRPHWGKLHDRTFGDLQPAYPRLADAVAVRDRVDPERRFANDYLARVLGS